MHTKIPLYTGTTPSMSATDLTILPPSPSLMFPIMSTSLPLPLYSLIPLWHVPSVIAQTTQAIYGWLSHCLFSGLSILLPPYCFHFSPHTYASWSPMGLGNPVSFSKTYDHVCTDAPTAHFTPSLLQPYSLPPSTSLSHTHTSPQSLSLPLDIFKHSSPPYPKTVLCHCALVCPAHAGTYPCAYTQT